jgi:ribonuclease P protein component
VESASGDASSGDATLRCAAVSTRKRPGSALWITPAATARLYSLLATRRTRAGILDAFLPDEAHLSTQRPPPQAQARVPRPDVDPRRPRDPEAAPRTGPQATLRLSALTVERRYRLSRSRDFDSVYRHGRSVSTRHLTLHWFPREDDPDGAPRLGLAVPKAVGTAVVRNRVKRQLREIWRELAPEAHPGHDYVLAARPGIAEPAASRGEGWLAEQVREALAKAGT